MDFNTFIKQLDDLKKQDLGGLEAQFKLSPELRVAYNQQKIASKNPKKAAVLALFYPSESTNEVLLLLTQRASYKGTHSSQISFPGGKVEKNDNSLAQTAIRETFEEVGIRKNEIRIIREMTPVYIPPSNFLATPYMGFTLARPSFKTNHEVAEIIEVNLKELLLEKNITTVAMTTSYMNKTKVPAFSIQNKIIWGATAMMLSEIKDLLKMVI